MSVRRATHAGSWYTDDTETLDSELDGWLGLVQDGALEGFHPPIAGCKAVIAPHAGYSYSGPAAAWAYKSIDTAGIKRVFILGPSHHEYINGCALSKCSSYETPIGSLPLDLETISKLRESGRFSDMSLRVDEREHSIEMHLPYVRKIFAGLDIKIVPVLVGAINKSTEAEFGAVLAPYLAEPDTVCVVSSDFCHWGTRFSYTFYYPAPPPGSTPVRLSRSVKPNTDHPIHKSITALDKQAMDILTLPSLAPDTKTAAQTHDAFASYLRETENSICGRHPIGVLLGALAEIEKGGKDATIKWVRYEQSSACTNISDSSVSYASAYVVF